MNKDLFGVQYNNKLPKAAFFWYVSTLRSTALSNIFLSEDRFLITTIDSAKVQAIKLKLRHKRKYAPAKKFFCAFTGRARFRSRFYAGLSRFAFRDLVKEGVFLIGVFRCG